MKTFLCVDVGQYSPGCGDGGDNITTEDYIFTEIKSRQITGHQGTLGTRWCLHCGLNLNIGDTMNDAIIITSAGRAPAD